MRRGYYLLVPLAFVIGSAVAASAAPPASPKVSYTGQITENGMPMNGRHYFVFTISSGAGPSATQAESLDVKNGIFRTLFTGPIAGLLAGRSSPGGENPTLTVSVDAGPTLPAIAVSVVPLAMEAAHAETASVVLNAAPPPGVAFVDHASPVTGSLTTSWTEVDNITLLAPAAGWVHISANGQLTLGSFTMQGCARLRLAETTPGAGETSSFQCGQNSANYMFSTEQVLPVTAGSHTLRLFTLGSGSGGTVGVYHLQAVWVPLRYQP